MLAPRYHFHRRFPIWMVLATFLITLTAINGRTWPRFVSYRSDYFDKIYTIPSNGQGERQANTSNPREEINSRSLSHFQADDLDRNNLVNGSSERANASTTVNSTCISGPYILGRDVNSSMFNLFCPTSSTQRNKFGIPGTCGLFVQCEPGESFVVMRCSNNDKEDNHRTEIPSRFYDANSGKCEISSEPCQLNPDALHNMNKSGLLLKILENMKNVELVEESVNIPQIIPQSLSEDEHVETTNLPADFLATSNNQNNNNNNMSSSISQATVNDELENLCLTGVSTPHGLHAHPHLCDKYIQCGAEAGTYFLKACGPGTVFNPKILNCDWPINVPECTNENPSSNGNTNKLKRRRRATSTTSHISCEIQGNDREVVIPDPENCNKYFVCSAAGNVYTSRECNKGTLFNPLTSVCDFADNVDCAGRKNDFGAYRCDNNDQYVAPHPDHCNKFVECRKGILAIKACPPATLYNREEEMCDHAHRVTCRKPISLEHDIDVNYIRKKRTPTYTPNGRLNLACEFNYIAPHPHNCYQFVECEERRIYIKDCGPGTAFNPLLGQCDWPHNVRQPDLNDCTRYRQCVKSHYQQRVCPPNQFFDADRSICIAGSPYQIWECSARNRPTTTRRTTTTTSPTWATPPPS